MKLHNLKPAKGSIKSKKRIARGVGAGTGRTATRGHKGAKSRSGYSQKRAFEGGQMPLQMRLPKRGFQNTHRRYKSSRPAEFKSFSLSQIAFFAEKHNLNELTPANLKALGVVTKPFKVLNTGELNKAIEVTANRFSAAAKKAIVDAGGKAYLAVSLSSLQGVADAADTDKVDVALLAKHFGFVAEDDAIHVIADGGAVSKKLNLEVHKISDEAKAQIEAQGGSVTLL
jgi:large subunit ribosomal protein L15